MLSRSSHRNPFRVRVNHHSKKSLAHLHIVGMRDVDEFRRTSEVVPGGHIAGYDNLQRYSRVGVDTQCKVERFIGRLAYLIDAHGFIFEFGHYDLSKF